MFELQQKVVSCCKYLATLSSPYEHPPPSKTHDVVSPPPLEMYTKPHHRPHDFRMRLSIIQSNRPVWFRHHHRHRRWHSPSRRERRCQSRGRGRGELGRGSCLSSVIGRTCCCIERGGVELLSCIVGFLAGGFILCCDALCIGGWRQISITYNCM